MSTNSNNDEPQLPITLVTTGAFNPVHRGHVALVEAAVTALRSRGLIVEAVLFSPSHDAYVAGKIGRTADGNLRTHFSGDERATMIEAAIGESDVLRDVARVSRVELDASGFIDHPALCRMLQRDMPTTRIVYVAGADLAVRLGGWSDRFPVVVVGRDDPTHPTAIDQRPDGTRVLVDASNAARRVVMREDARKLRFLLDASHDPQVAAASSTAVSNGEFDLLPAAVVPLLEAFLASRKSKPNAKDELQH